MLQRDRERSFTLQIVKTKVSSFTLSQLKLFAMRECNHHPYILTVTLLLTTTTLPYYEKVLPLERNPNVAGLL